MRMLSYETTSPLVRNVAVPPFFGFCAAWATSVDAVASSAPASTPTVASTHTLRNRGMSSSVWRIGACNTCPHRTLLVVDADVWAGVQALRATAACDIHRDVAHTWLTG